MERHERIENAIGPTLKTLDSVLSLIDRSKETSVPLKGNVWKIATGSVPGLERFESVARELKKELQEWQDESERLNDALQELEDEMEREKVEYDRASRLFDETMAAMESLEDKTEKLEKRLRDVSNRSSEIAEKASGIPVLGTELHDRFETLSSRLSETADDVVRLKRKPSDVIEVNPEPESRIDDEPS